MITIHGVPISVHTRKVIVSAIIKGMGYRSVPVIPFNPPADWRSLSPTGLIPAIEDGDFRLADSSAICQYLERKIPEPSLLPDDAQAYGKAIWFEAYGGGTVFRHAVHGLFFQRIIRPFILNETTDTKIIDCIQNDVVPGIFNYLNSQTRKHYLVGAGLTIADISVVSSLINYQYLGYAIDPKTYPNLSKYTRDIVASAPFATALAAERPFAERMGLDRRFLD